MLTRIMSKSSPGTLLHIVHRFQDSTEQTELQFTRENVVRENEFIQLSVITMPQDHTFAPHAHIWRTLEVQPSIAQESWVVIRGSVRVSLFDLDDTLLGEEILGPGDCSITLQGGHTYTSLAPGTRVYEYKTGPYLGVELDKRQLG